MSFMQEFKEFTAKGNAVDLAVGVIIGAAFGKIVDSIINDLIMPIVSGIIGQPDFSYLYIALGSIPSGINNTLADLKEAGIPVFAYGNFITVVLNFFLLAVVIFFMVKQINKLRKVPVTEPAPAPAPAPEDIQLLREIRDSLKNK